jgi:small subunit ribosomal protein S16
MLKIRLQRVGRKNDPAFRIVLTDSKTAVKKSGSFTKVLGSMEAKSGKVSLDKDAITQAIGHGAQVSHTVHNILVKNSVIEGTLKNVLPLKSKTSKKKDLKK